VSIHRQNTESSFTVFLLLYRICMHQVIQRHFNRCFLPLNYSIPKKTLSRCPDAVTVNCCHGPYSFCLLVHLWYSRTYPMESVCSKMDKQATGVNANTVERAKSLFSGTLLRLDEIDGPYFYEVSGDNNISGSLSFLLSVSDAQLLSVYKFCGFYSTTRSCFSEDFFRTFLKAFNVPTNLLRYRNKKKGVRLLYLKIGKGSYLSKPAQQIKDELKPPEHRFKKDDRQLVADLLSLCCRKD
jgi:hypothetical protein